MLAKAAGDADGVAKVSAAMEAAPSEAGQRGCLEALAAMCAQEDDSRQAVPGGSGPTAIGVAVEVVPTSPPPLRGSWHQAEC